MEITTFGMYLFTRLDGIVKLSGFLCCIFCACFFVGLVVYLLSLARNTKDEKYANDISLKIVKSKLFIFAILVLLSIANLLPTQKEFAAIYLVPKIVNNEQIQKLPVNAVELINKQFESWLNDLQPEKVE